MTISAVNHAPAKNSAESLGIVLAKKIRPACIPKGILQTFWSDASLRNLITPALTGQFLVSTFPFPDPMHQVKVTYYLEVLSSWCHYAEPVWTSLQERYHGKVEFEWKLALMLPGDFPVSQAQCDWFYRRSGPISQQPQMLSSGWFDAKLKGNYEAANLVAEAGRDFGFTDDRLRRFLTTSALRDGRKIGEPDTAVSLVAQKFKLNTSKLRAAAESKAVRQRVEASTTAFHAHKINQRPAFIITDTIGDKAVFSGLGKIEPLVATIDSMLADCTAYASFSAHFGPIPAK